MLKFLLSVSRSPLPTDLANRVRKTASSWNRIRSLQAVLRIITDTPLCCWDISSLYGIEQRLALSGNLIEGSLESLFPATVHCLDSGNVSLDRCLKLSRFIENKATGLCLILKNLGRLRKYAYLLAVWHLHDIPSRVIHSLLSGRLWFFRCYLKRLRRTGYRP